MSQPEWQYVGHIGDVDPIAHGGGFVYKDLTGVYPPEVAYFEPGSDKDWHKTKGATPLQAYRFILERNPRQEWWWDGLDSVADSCGQDRQYFRNLATAAAARMNDDAAAVIYASLYQDLIHYHGAHEFDHYPVTMTEDEAYAKYADEMNASLGRTV